MIYLKKIIIFILLFTMLFTTQAFANSPSEESTHTIQKFSDINGSV